jgi:hypothetical protein
MDKWILAEDNEKFSQTSRAGPLDGLMGTRRRQGENFPNLSHRASRWTNGHSQKTRRNFLKPLVQGLSMDKWILAEDKEKFSQTSRAGPLDGQMGTRRRQGEIFPNLSRRASRWTHLRISRVFRVSNGHIVSQNPLYNTLFLSFVYYISKTLKIFFQILSLLLQ